MTLERKDATGKDVNVIVKQVQKLMVLATLRVTGAIVYIDMTHGVTISITIYFFCRAFIFIANFIESRWNKIIFL